MMAQEVTFALAKQQYFIGITIREHIYLHLVTNFHCKREKTLTERGIPCKKYT
jgi:hypothetical protein